MSCEQQQLPYGMQKAEGEVYMVIRFRTETIERLRTSCCRQIKVIEGYRGKVIGIADSVKVYEDDNNSWPSNRAMMLIQFKTEREARLWIESDEKFKNKDFPLPSDSLEIFMVPEKYIVSPGKDYLTYSLEEMSNISDVSRMKQEYIDPVAKCMDTFGVAHGCCFDINATGIRCSFLKKNSIVVLHRYKSVEHFENFFKSDAFAGLKQKRKELCNTTVVVFTLHTDLTKPIGGS